jgi:hypothetical protein
MSISRSGGFDSDKDTIHRLHTPTVGTSGLGVHVSNLMAYVAYVASNTSTGQSYSLQTELVADR